MKTYLVPFINVTARVFELSYVSLRMNVKSVLGDPRVQLLTVYVGVLANTPPLILGVCWPAR